MWTNTHPKACANCGAKPRNTPKTVDAWNATPATRAMEFLKPNAVPGRTATTESSNFVPRERMVQRNNNRTKPWPVSIAKRANTPMSRDKPPARTVWRASTPAQPAWTLNQNVSRAHFLVIFAHRVPPRSTNGNAPLANTPTGPK